MSVLVSSDSSPSSDNNRLVTPQNQDLDATSDDQTNFSNHITSVQLPVDASKLKVNQMAKLWKVDLVQQNTFVGGEINLVTTVFNPPFAVDYSLLSKMKTFSFDTGWKELPGEWTEPAAASFLNLVVSDIGRVTGQAFQRYWTLNQILPGSQKPDIVLLDINHEEPVHWRNIRALTEVMRSKAEIDRVVYTFNDNTFTMLTTQFNRTFVPVISIFDKYFRLAVTDRQGHLCSIVYNLSGPHALHLVHLLATLCFGSPGAIGYDPSVLTNSRDETTAIICDTVTYKVLHCIHAVQRLFGRATHVFLVESNNQQFILKDSWVETSDPYSEMRHLKRIQGVQGVPVLEHGWNVKILNEVLSTWLIRQGNYGSILGSRVRRRLVTSSIGVPISQFKTKRELISAFRDITETHYEICNNRNTVHRDISINNIMLFKEEDAATKLRRGLLIDFDNAAKITDSEEDSPSHYRTGTPPFMALDILLGPDEIRHEPRFDLESIFYVLVYLCINLKGPENRIRSNVEMANFRSFPVAEWFTAEGSFRRLGRVKLSQLQTFEDSILPYIAPYFYDLIPCIKKFHKALCPGGDSRKSPITHHQVITIFEETLVLLPELENFPSDILQIPLLGNVAPVGRKRSFLDMELGYY